MALFGKSQVYPAEMTLLPTEDSSSSESEISDPELEADVRFHVGDEGTSKSQSSQLGTKTNDLFYFDWKEFLEDFESELEERIGSKSQLYMLDGTPLQKCIKTGGGLHLLTDEVLTAYGLEFLGVVSEAVLQAHVDQKIPLAEILLQLQTLDYKVHSGKKLWIWIEDQPLKNPHTSFGRLLSTELLNRNIEPQMIIPCHDLDEEVLHTLAKTLSSPEEKLTSSSTEESVDGGEVDAASIVNVISKEFAVKLQGIFKIGLSLALAAKNCNIIIIDVDRFFYDVPDFHNFMDFAEHLGHKVIYLRSTPEMKDKEEVIQSLVVKVMKWIKSKSPEEDSTTLPKTIDTEILMDDTTSEEEEIPSIPTSVGQPQQKSSEIIYKLTPAHFTLPDEQDNSDEST